MAKQALSSLPVEHAMEMMDYVMENHGYLRNPSNYISSTVARGFVPRRSSQAVVVHGGKGAGGPSSVSYNVVTPVNQTFVPSDASALEKRVLHFNSICQPQQQIDFITYLALRCVPQWQYNELLDSLEAKSGVIASPCNYIQAAVTKIQRGQGWSGGGGGGGSWGGGGGAHSGGKPYGGPPAAAADSQSFKRQRMW